MDRLNQIRGEAGDLRDSTFDTSSPPSEAFMSANESSSKYFSLSEVDSTFSISPSKDSSSCTTTEPDRTLTVNSDLISNLSPIPKKSDLDSYKIGKQIEAANILSGGVNIFDDNDNSYDGDELVIDDNALNEEKPNSELKLSENTVLEKSLNETLDDTEAVQSKDTEVVLQIDGKNVNGIDIGNGLYLYRKAGKEELAAVQIIDDDQHQPSFKFLKVRENAEGNLEVYEEIEVEISKEVLAEDGGSTEKSSHVPIRDINKVINEPCSKTADKISKTPKIESNSTHFSELNLDLQSETKTEVNLNGKMMKFNECRKSPLIGTFTPMTYHSTPNKEGIPLTKTMVDQQLHPSRHSDNIKKTIEVHTDSSKQKALENPAKTKDLNMVTKLLENDTSNIDNEETKTEIKYLEQSSAINTDITLRDSTVKLGYNKSAVEKDIEQGLNLSEKQVANRENVIAKEAVTKSNDDQKGVDSLEETNDNKIINKSELQSIDTEMTSQNLEEDASSKGLQHYQEEKQIEKSVEKIPKSIESKIEGNIHKDNETKVDEVLSMNQDIKELIQNSPPSRSSSASNKISCNEKIEETITTKSVTNEKNIEGLNMSAKIEAHRNEGSGGKISIEPINATNIVLEENNSLEIKKMGSLTQNIKDSDKVADDIKYNISAKENEVDKASGGTVNKMDLDGITKDKEVTTNESINTSLDINFKDNKQIKRTEMQQEHVIQEINKSIVNKKEVNEIVPSSLMDSNKETVILESEKPISSCTTRKLVPDTQTTNNVSSSTGASKIIIKDIKITKSEASNNKPIVIQKIAQKTNVPVTKPINNNSAVPFGKWTEANRQEFLNKIKETKVPTNNSNSKQLKQPNDLNRRDVLQKIDSQRHATVNLLPKSTDFGSIAKLSCRNDPISFTNKTASLQKTNINTQVPVIKPKAAVGDKNITTGTLNTELESVQTRTINGQELIDKTIEGIITKAIWRKNIPDHMKQKNTIHTVENPKNTKPVPGSLDDIEMKMNELHGISFTDPPSQPQVQKNDSNTFNKTELTNINKYNKIPSLQFKTKDQTKGTRETTHNEVSDDEIIEHEPITGDISKQSLISLLSKKEKPLPKPKKDTVITEKDFDKFARRNSITYENRLTVNFDGKEQHNVIQTVIEKEPVKKLTRNELLLAESKAKSSNKQNIAARHNNQTSKIPTLRSTNEDESYNKNYQSKVQIAYQSALTAKRNLECPITIIEDKPVKVVFMDTHTEFTTLNVQGQELSPSKSKTDFDLVTHGASDSLDSDTLDSSQEMKTQDETKSKSKHQRKQVLTPVEEPELELIEPSDLGFKVSPMKKRKVKDDIEKNSKNLVPKKSYLLNRNVAEDQPSKSDQVNNTFQETENRNETFHSDAISAIDNLVKAAELIENQSENNSTKIIHQSTEMSQNTPIKRGRGRPRKYPLPEPDPEINKSLSPQKKPRLIDAKIPKSYTDSDDSSDGEIVKENWTMGKINENIVCPICNKLFRSENVVFKHVKHCTGPSPNRSDSDKRSPRRQRHSRDSDGKMRDSSSDDTDDDEDKIETLKSNNNAKPSNIDDDVIVIEDTPIKEKASKHTESKKLLRNAKTQHNANNLICEFCGKTFRQLSYLVSHKLQHKKEETKKSDIEKSVSKSVFSCDVCNKEFRKLHHLVQHRLIHNPNSMATRLHRKSSSEQHENKNSKNQSDDATAGFRCEPCDKSFRKLHHLVEHRETHDGINKKGSACTQGTTEAQKVQQSHPCDMCKMVFKKLQDLLEHKEQHFETSSEKSDDKSVKSSLSTKDIIHECSLCYMVFPNEHSLNKHTIFCLRKKKQSAAKQAAKQAQATEANEAENINSDDNTLQDIDSNSHTDDNKLAEEGEEIQGSENSIQLSKGKEKFEDIENKDDFKLRERKHSLETPLGNLHEISKKRHSSITEDTSSRNENIEIPAKIKRVDDKECEIITDTPTPKTKILHKDKIAPTVTKRHKTIAPLPVINEPLVESSDDDEVRYMLNPNYKEEDNSESKIFMKIRATKRNSLQIERPSSKDLIKRRISLQHPPKMPRLKVKAIETKPRNVTKDEKHLRTNADSNAAISTDSDENDVKYSFPETVHTKVKSEKKVKKQIAGKRKSLSGIAKKKSLGKLPTPKKRAAEVGHRCDCGQFFSSAALLARHATLAHTPPRIRRRRSCDASKQNVQSNKTSAQSNTVKPNSAKSSTTQSTKKSAQPTKDDSQSTKRGTQTAKPRTSTNTSGAAQSNKSTAQSTKPSKPSAQSKKIKTDDTDSKKTTKVGVATRKSSVSSSEAKPSVKSSDTTIKSLRSAHRGVPVPEKLRKLLEKPKK